MMKTPNRETAPGRRGFLKVTAAGALGIAVLGYVERLMPAAPLADASARRVTNQLLSATEFDTLEAVARIVVGAPEGQPSTRDAHTAERVELELTKAWGKLASDVKAALKVVEYLPVFWGEGARLTRLPVDKQIQMVERMRLHDNMLVRSAYNGLRFLCIFFYYTDSRTWQRIGYSGPAVQAKFYEAGNSIVNLPKMTGGPK